MALDSASFALVLFQQRRQPPSGLRLPQPEVFLFAGIVPRNITVKPLCKALPKL